MTATLRSYLPARATAIVLAVSLLINGIVPQRILGSRHSLILAVGKAGFVATASLFTRLHDPLAGTALLLAGKLLPSGRPDTVDETTPGLGKSAVTDAGDAAFAAPPEPLPQPGEGALSSGGSTAPGVLAQRHAADDCRASPAALTDAGRAVRICLVLKFFVISRWASSTDAVRHILPILEGPVFNECRVFLFSYYRILPCMPSGMFAHPGRVS